MKPNKQEEEKLASKIKYLPLSRKLKPFSLDTLAKPPMPSKGDILTPKP